MEKYGYKPVVKGDEFREGIIVERAENGEIVARAYTKNEYNERVASDWREKIDFPEVAKKKTPIGKMREIAKQLGHGNFAIDESVVEIIK